MGTRISLAGATGRLQAVDTRFDLSETYTLWSGLIGGLFLSLSYFGCDQSQVQRYLTAKSIDEARHSLLMSAFVKIPLQLLILCDRRPGVPLLHRSRRRRCCSTGRTTRRSPPDRTRRNIPVCSVSSIVEVAARRDAGMARNTDAFLASDSRLKALRAQAADVVKKTTGDQRYSDVNYVFPTFITTHLPVGLVGLMIAAIFAAAMSASSGELSALSSATIIDFYQRHFVKNADDAHYLKASKVATASWGLFSCFVAMYAANQGSLIEVVNRYGSFFYGSILGVFILALLTKRATATGAFVGLVAGMAVVLSVAFGMPWIAFLWHNLIGAVVVVAVGMVVSSFSR